ncbi:MAG: alpha/beta hydrolase [Bacteroidota bacterium]
MKFILRLLGLVLLLCLIVFVALYKSDIPIEKMKAMYAQPPSQFLEIDGLEVHYRDEGVGQPIVLLHGTGASLHTWDEWTEALRPCYRVIRLDLPAFGLTGPRADRDYSEAATVAVIDKLLEKLDADSIIIGGNSYGGRMALHYTNTHPEKVDQLILVDASAYHLKGDPESSTVFKLANTPVLNQVMTKIALRGFVKSSLLEVYHDDSQVTDELIQRYYDMSLRAGNRQAFVDRVTTQYENNLDWISNIQQPTLILWGEQDPWTVVSHAYAFEQDLPNDSLIVYPNAGHVPMEEIGQETVRDVLWWLGVR